MRYALLIVFALSANVFFVGYNFARRDWSAMALSSVAAGFIGACLVVSLRMTERGAYRRTTAADGGGRRG